MAGIGFGAVTIGGNSIDNYKTAAGNGLGPTTRIYALTMDSGNVTQDALDGIVQAISLTATVAGIAGGVGSATAHIAVQGGAVIADDASDALGVTGTNIAIVCTFDDDAQNGGVTV